MGPSASTEPGEGPRGNEPAVGRGLLPRRLALGALALVLILGSLALPAGCVNRVTPPPNVSDPVLVFLIDHGRTPSLVLPTPEGGMARYVYGDWRWYALGRTGILNGIAAVAWPTQGGVGREVMEGADSAEDVERQMNVTVEHMYPLVVERADAERLRMRLDEMFERAAAGDGKAVGAMVYNADHQLTFVHHPDRYTYLWNSNHQVSSWLRELGCEVRGPTINSRWQVRDEVGSSHE